MLIELHQIRGQDSRSSRNLNEKLSPGYTWPRRAAYKDPSTQTWQSVGLNFGVACRKAAKKAREARLGRRDAQTRQCSKIERHLFYRFGRRRV